MNLDVQSLSVCVPAPHCINRCKYCVSGMHQSQYEQLFDINKPDFRTHFQDFITRLKFAKENQANTVILTGEVEPLQNREFLSKFAIVNQYVLPYYGCSSFDWIEIQSSGVLFDREYAEFLRNFVRVQVFSFSLSSFDDEENANLVGMPESRKIKISEVCQIAKEYGFTLRLCLNMSDYMIRSVSNLDSHNPNIFDAFFQKAKSLNADQLTFRKLYASGNNAQSQWVEDHQVDESFFSDLNDYVQQNGKLAGILPYGFKQYIVHGVSVVIDNDCMNEEQANEIGKYLVVRPNCKIYKGWHKSDLIF